MLDKKKYLSEKEQKQLFGYWNQMKKLGGKRNINRWLLVNVALGTGCRSSELCDIEPNDIDFGEYPSISVKTKKGGERSIVYISNKLASDLKWYFKHNQSVSKYLFTTERANKQTPTGLWSIWRNCLKRSGLPHYKLHSTRHTFATNIYRQSKDLRLTQKQLRHKSINSTMVYADVSVEDIRSVMNMV